MIEWPTHVRKINGLLPDWLLDQITQLMTPKEQSNIKLYLERYAVDLNGRDMEPPGSLDIAIVIPCHDEPDLVSSLIALSHCEIGAISILVVVVINAAEKAAENVKDRNLATYNEAFSWAKEHNSSGIDFRFVIDNNMPSKHAGVGLARKLGMDLVAKIFYKLGHNGVILCFDADSLCEPNYILEVYNFFKENPRMPGCSIHYEHPLKGNLSLDNYNGIIQYELHLRYYINALRFAGFPYAYHTIGSSMAVRAHTYAQQGGMNRRKAGEDFYFLHKIIPLGHFGELKSTAVIPSARKSHRVPFGTGKAIGDWVESESKVLLSYNPNTFLDLKKFIQIVKSPEKSSLMDTDSREAWPDSIAAYLDTTNFAEAVVKIRRNTANPQGFEKAFFQWFDGFRVLKYVHFARDNFFPNIPIEAASKWWFDVNGIDYTEGSDALGLLLQVRALDRQ